MIIDFQFICINFRYWSWLGRITDDITKNVGYDGGFLRS